MDEFEKKTDIEFRYDTQMLIEKRDKDLDEDEISLKQRSRGYPEILEHNK